MSDAEEDLVDRPQGVLTKKEREQFLGRLDEEGTQTARQRRYRVRKRLHHALIDFHILAGVYDEAGLDDAIVPFEGDDFPNPSANTIEESMSYSDPALASGISGVFEILYRTLGKADPSEFSAFKDLLNDGAGTALNKMYAKEGWVPILGQAAFDIPVHNRVRLYKVKQAYENDEFLSLSELRHLYWAGEITYEEFEQARNEHPTTKIPDSERLDVLYESHAERREKDGLSGPLPSRTWMSSDEEFEIEKQTLRERMAERDDDEED